MFSTELNNYKVSIPYFDNIKCYSIINIDYPERVFRIAPPNIEYMGEVMANYADPTYNNLKGVEHISSEIVFLDWLYDNISWDTKDINYENKLRKIYKRMGEEGLTFNQFFVDREIITDEKYLFDLYKKSFVTEEQVSLAMQGIKIKRNGRNIIDYPLQGLNEQLETEPFIMGSMQLVHPIEIYGCIVETNSSLVQWRGMEGDEKVTTIALYRMNSLREAHARDIQNKETKT